MVFLGVESRIAAVHRAVQEMSPLSASEISARMGELRQELQTTADPSLLEPQILAFAFHSVRHVLGKDLYDVQIQAALAMIDGCIAEMAAGEGKTLAAVPAAAYHALAGQGVHVATANPYLAERDFNLLKPVYALLGLTTGITVPGDSNSQKKQAYNADITYGVGYEFGFDYLRDQLAMKARQRLNLGEQFRRTLRGIQNPVVETVQRGHHFAIVDEADSVLIDEARTPLIISGASSGDEAENATVYRQAHEVAQALAPEKDFIVDDAAGRIELTEEGQQRIYAQEIPKGVERPWRSYVLQALRAQIFQIRDVNYIVTDEDKVCIVDAYTGRRYEERSWQDGLHQAVQAKEGVKITAETKSSARITRQRYFGLYTILSGMTGTARESDRELREIYDLSVRVIPPRRENKREILPTAWHPDSSARWAAIAHEAKDVHLTTGRPVLIGTRTVHDSESVAEHLRRQGIYFRLLNARQDRYEAEIIARAGERKTVTIATNMAGRGADIPLGEGVEGLGGLYVIAAEHFESGRIDRQLAGRAARQGQPGTCRFHTVAEDTLWQRAGTSRIRHGKFSNSKMRRHIARAQLKCEQNDATTRVRMMAHDTYMDELLERMTGN